MIPPRPARLLLPALAMATAAVAVAMAVWTAPLRAERALKTASLSELEDAAQRSPNNPRSLYHLGLRWLQLGQPEPAEPALRRAASLDSDDEKSWLGAAVAAAARGDVPGGLGIAITFARRHPDSAAGHYTIAQLCRQQDSLRHAYEEAMTAARLAPRDANSWRLAGEAAMHLGDLPAAEQALRQAVEQDPCDWRSRVALGDLLSRRGRSAEGVTCFEIAGRLAPAEALPPLLLGRQLLSQAVSPAQIETARRYLLRSAEIQASNAEVNHQLGRGEIRLARWKSARDYLDRARRFAPASVAIASELVSADKQLGDARALERDTHRQRQLLAYENQKRRLVDEATSDPADPEKLLALARLCAWSGDNTLASRYYRLLLAHAAGQAGRQEWEQEWEAVRGREAEESPLPVTSPEPTAVSSDETPVRILLRDADTFLTQGRNDEARSAYLSILARDPRVAAACEGLARVMVADGDREQAFAYFEKAGRLDAQLWRTQLELGARYGASGRYREAARHYRQGLGIVPRNAEGWHAFGATLADDPNSYQEAEEALGRAVALQPDNVAFLRDLASLQARQHHLKVADASFRRALALAPDDAETQSLLAGFLIGERPGADSLREAGQLLRAAATSAPGDPMIAYWRGRLALQQGDARGAIDLLRHAAPYIDRSIAVSLWYNLSRAYLVAGDAVRSRAAQARADRVRDCQARITTVEDRLSRDPRNADINLQLARLYGGCGEIAAAVKQYERTERLDPVDAAPRAERAKLEGLLRAHDSTSASAAPLLALQPGHEPQKSTRN